MTLDARPHRGQRRIVLAHEEAAAAMGNAIPLAG
jgi:hypothetical protein